MTRWRSSLALVAGLVAVLGPGQARAFQNDCLSTSNQQVIGEGQSGPCLENAFGDIKVQPTDQFGQALGTPSNPITITIQPSVSLKQPSPLGIAPALGSGQTAGSPIVVLSNQGALRGPTGAVQGDYGLVVHPSIAPALQCPFVVGINQTAATQIVTGGSGKRLHVCSFQVVSATAQNVSLIEGTGSVCATGSAGLWGGTTASVALAANGGGGPFSDRIILPMQTIGDNLCVLQSGAGNVSGTLTYGIYQ